MKKFILFFSFYIFLLKIFQENLKLNKEFYNNLPQLTSSDIYDI